MHDVKILYNLVLFLTAIECLIIIWVTNQVKHWYNRLKTYSSIADNFTEQELADLVREMEILKQFDPHPHVIQLYGACTQNGKPISTLFFQFEFLPRAGR